jgi:protocatechuate 3,4-dioxygenase alpha subunit
MADEKRLVASPSQTIGPFLHVGFEHQVELRTLGDSSTPGPRIRLRIRVVDGVGAPIDDGLVEIWQVDSEGRSAARTPASESAMPPNGFRGWGRCSTDAGGWSAFETIAPAPTATSDGRRAAAHINICVFARGLLRHVFTRCYFAGDPALDGDPVLELVPPVRRDTLVARPDGDGWAFEIHMQGANETVFFDL